MYICVSFETVFDMTDLCVVHVQFHHMKHRIVMFVQDFKNHCHAELLKCNAGGHLN